MTIATTLSLASSTNNSFFPVFRITEKEYKEVLHFALNMHTSGETDKEPKDAVFQIVTSRFSEKDHPKNFYERLFNIPKCHVSVRIITKDQAVYSFGSSEDATAYEHESSIVAPDLKEWASAQEKLITSIPVKSSTADEILDLMWRFAHIGISEALIEEFFTFQVDFAMQLAGGRVETRVSLGECAGCVTLHGDLIDFLSYPFMKVLSFVQAIVYRVLPCIVENIPEEIERLFFWMKEVVLYIPRKVVIIARNALKMLFGGAFPYDDFKRSFTRGEISIKSIPSFIKNIVYRFSHLFYDQTWDMHSSIELMKWQRQKSSTHLYRNYDGEWLVY